MHDLGRIVFGGWGETSLAEAAQEQAVLQVWAIERPQPQKQPRTLKILRL